MPTLTRSPPPTVRLVVVGLFACTRSAVAHAETGAPSAAAPSADETPFQHAVISFDGLGVPSGRYGVTGEAALSARDAVALSPWFLTGESTGAPDPWAGMYASDFTDYDVQTRGFGAGVQYRRYVGDFHGPRGFFLAPGVDVSHFVTESVGCTHTHGDHDDEVTTTCAGPNRQAWTYLGGSIDFGGQAILPAGLTLGASLGVRYRGVVGGRLDESVMPFGWEVSHGSGLRPRFRLWAGFAFL